jgi:myo-inositol-1(or 4)-monophosphatase|tara:strand:+ start:1571 stop:2320 length:750 start_codon:yes stop_codon:yes gene_type:complete
MDAAGSATAYISEESEKVRQIKFKGASDLVTQADRGSEEIILNEIKNHFPDHNILTEESEGQSTESLYTWIIDPLDGTTNFVHGYPFYAVSIAVFNNGSPIVGVIVDIHRKHTYHAVIGEGAFRNDKPINVSETNRVEHSLFATGFPYIHDELWAKNFEYMKAFTDIGQGVRLAGTASIDLAHIACGWLDGFWEVGLHPWDTAAGILLISEAGGQVTKMDGREFSIFDNQICASNRIIHSNMLNLFKET